MRTRTTVCLASALLALAAFPVAAENKTDSGKKMEKATNYVNNIRLPDPPKESTGTVKQSTTTLHKSDFVPEQSKHYKPAKAPPPPAKSDKK